MVPQTLKTTPLDYEHVIAGVTGITGAVRLVTLATQLKALTVDKISKVVPMLILAGGGGLTATK